MMIFGLKQSDTWKLKQSDTCVNGGLLNDDTLIKRRLYLCQWWKVSLLNKPPLTQVSPYFNQSIIIQ
jgi:hypothetical protein